MPIAVEDFNPRYVIFAYPVPPSVLLDSAIRSGGGCMYAFILWINRRWREFDTIMGWHSRDPIARSDEAMFWFDLWLLAGMRSDKR